MEAKLLAPMICPTDRILTTFCVTGFLFLPSGPVPLTLSKCLQGNLVSTFESPCSGQISRVS